MYIGFWLFVLQPGSLCSEKSGQHKTPSGMTVDHRNMLRRTQTLTYTVSITEIECTSQSIGKGWIQSDVLTFFLLVIISFHASGPDWPQETQHTGLQEVLVLKMVRALFFFPPPFIIENFSSDIRSQPYLPVLRQNAKQFSVNFEPQQALVFLYTQEVMKKRSTY